MSSPCDHLTGDPSPTTDGVIEKRRSVGSLLLFAVLIGILACMASRCLDAPFFLDDVQEAARVDSFQSWQACFQCDSFSFFRPLKNLLFYGVGPSWQRGHLISLLLYVGMATSLFWGFSLWFNHRGWALLAVSVWALAATQASALVWLSCANITLSGTCVISALCCYARLLLCHRRRETTKALLYLLACLGLYLGGLLAYEGAVALPLLMALLHVTRFANLGWRPSLRPGLLVASVTVVYALLRWHWVPQDTGHGQGVHVTANWQLSLASAYFAIDHLWSWLVPFGRQEILGTFVWGQSIDGIRLSLCWSLVLLLLLLAFRLRHRARDVTFGLSWYFISFLPMSNLFAFGNGPLADYYLVLPSVGLALVLVACAQRLMLCLALEGGRPLWRCCATGLLALLIVWRGGGAVTMADWCETWRSPEKLFATSLNVRPCPVRARGNLAMALAKRGHLENAETLVRLCLEEAPWYALGYSMLGRIRESQRVFPEAETLYLLALDHDGREPYARQGLARLRRKPGVTRRSETDGIFPPP